jgi:hypothetical protein
MSVQTLNLFTVEDLEDPGRTGALEQDDLAALRAVSGWIKTFVAKPHKDLGRPGPVCPFVPGALERRTLWLAPEQLGDRDGSAVAELVDGYRRLFLEANPAGSADAQYRVVVVVFTDLSADRAQGVFDNVLEHLAARAYEQDGILFGPFHDRNEGTAIYNSSFRPFRSPAPFLFIRHGVVSDWKFFLDDEDQLNRWAARYGAAGAQALAEELRHLPWRAQRSR